MYLFDSHCHLDILFESKDFQAKIKESFTEELKSNKLKEINQIGIDYPSSLFALLLSNIGRDLEEIKDLPDSYQAALNYYKSINLNNLLKINYSLGLHPSNVKKKANEQKKIRIIAEKFKDDPKFIGIGEVGLDFYWQKDNKNEQVEIFIDSMELAQSLKKPIIIHSRDAFEDTYDIVKNHYKGNGVLHCYTGNKEWAKKFLELGFYISFSGIVTFKNAKEIQEACVYVPADKILIETDSPYLAPVPKRGKTNRPAWVKHTFDFIVNLRKENAEKFNNQINKNTNTLFHLKK